MPPVPDPTAPAAETSEATPEAEEVATPVEASFAEELAAADEAVASVQLTLRLEQLIEELYAEISKLKREGEYADREIIALINEQFDALDRIIGELLESDVDTANSETPYAEWVDQAVRLAAQLHEDAVEAEAVADQHTATIAELREMLSEQQQTIRQLEADLVDAREAGSQHQAAGNLTEEQAA